MKHKRVREPDTASRYVPEPTLVPIAAQRTRAILRTFLADAAWNPIDMMILAESCYMQGVHDTIEAAIRSNGFKFDDPLPPVIDQPAADIPWEPEKQKEEQP